MPRRTTAGTFDYLTNGGNGETTRKAEGKSASHGAVGFFFTRETGTGANSCQPTFDGHVVPSVVDQCRDHQHQKSTKRFEPARDQASVARKTTVGPHRGYPLSRPTTVVAAAAAAAAAESPYTQQTPTAKQQRRQPPDVVESRPVVAWH